MEIENLYAASVGRKETLTGHTNRTYGFRLEFGKHGVYLIFALNSIWEGVEAQVWNFNLDSWLSWLSERKTKKDEGRRTCRD